MSLYAIFNQCNFRICEVVGSNVDEVSRAIGYDSRVGSKFMKASVGFGGFCFQRYILNLVYIARSYNLTVVADYREASNRCSNQCNHSIKAPFISFFCL